MCGLFGYITKKDTLLTPEQQLTRLRITNGLAVAMETRGTDSTGVAGLVNGKIQLIKDTQNAFKFIASDDYKQFIAKNPSLLIGHTRFATIGAVTVPNAHPFKLGRIVGAHNGHVIGYKQHYLDAEVDSQAIFHLLNKNNNDYHKSFKELSGNLTITWFDVVKADKLYLVSHVNPLAIVKIQELDTIFWASEITALKSIIEATIGSDKRKFIDLPEDTIYKISTSLTFREEKTQFKEIETNQGNWQYSQYECDATDTESCKKYYCEIHKEEKIYLDDVIPTDELKMEFKSIINLHTCGMCKHDMKQDIKKGFHFDYDSFDILCSECMEELGNIPSIIYITNDIYKEFIKPELYESKYYADNE